MRRGEIFWASITPRSGSEQSGMRPVIIISNNGFNKTTNWKSIIVIPCTTSFNQINRSQTVLELPSCDLIETTHAICHQITTLDRTKILKKIGDLSAEDLSSVERGILNALALNFKS